MEKMDRKFDATCSTQATAVVTDMYLSHSGDDIPLAIGKRVRLVCTRPEPHDEPHLFEVVTEDYV